MSEPARRCPRCDGVNPGNPFFCAECGESLMDFGVPGPQGDTAEPSGASRSQSARNTAPQRVVARLRCLGQPEFIFEIRSGSIVGRQGDADVSPLDGSIFISRRHARFVLEDGLWHVEHISHKSRTTRVNGVGVPRCTRQVVRSGDRITLANTSFVFEEIES